MSFMFGNLLVKFYLKWIERKGFIHGKNFDLEKGANIDAAFCNLIKVGNPLSHNSCDRRSSIVEDQEHATKDSWNLSIL